MDELILTARYVLHTADATPELHWGVAVRGDRIAVVGPAGSLREQFPSAPILDLPDQAIAPGFVNAHHHMYGVLSHGIPLEQAPAGFWPFLEEFWWPRVEDALTHEMIALATDMACLEMVRSGVTSFYDCLEAPNALPGALDVEAEVVRRWGLRGILSFEATQRQSEANGQLGLAENAGYRSLPRRRRAGTGDAVLPHDVHLFTGLHPSGVRPGRRARRQSAHAPLGRELRAGALPGAVWPAHRRAV